MLKSKPGRPEAQSEQFLNKTLLGNDQIRAQPARSPKWPFYNLRCHKKLTKSGLSRPGTQIKHFLNKALIESA